MQLFMIPEVNGDANTMSRLIVQQLKEKLGKDSFIAHAVTDAAAVNIPTVKNIQ